MSENCRVRPSQKLEPVSEEMMQAKERAAASNQDVESRCVRLNLANVGAALVLKVMCVRVMIKMRVAVR